MPNRSKRAGNQATSNRYAALAKYTPLDLLLLRQECPTGKSSEPNGAAFLASQAGSLFGRNTACMPGDVGGHCCDELACTIISVLAGIVQEGFSNRRGLTFL